MLSSWKVSFSRELKLFSTSLGMKQSSVGNMVVLCRNPFAAFLPTVKTICPLHRRLFREVFLLQLSCSVLHLLHNTTMFPTDDCFIPNDEENSFSSLLKETFHDDSIYKDNKEFLIFLSSNRSAWYTCCNEVRGSLIFKSKDIYFREYNQWICLTITVSDTLHSMKGLSAQQRARFGKEQCQKMLKGRKEPSVYIHFLMTFGGVYVKKNCRKERLFVQL